MDQFLALGGIFGPLQPAASAPPPESPAASAPPPEPPAWLPHSGDAEIEAVQDPRIRPPPDNTPPWRKYPRVMPPPPRSRRRTEEPTEEATATEAKQDGDQNPLDGAVPKLVPPPPAPDPRQPRPRTEGPEGWHRGFAPWRPGVQGGKQRYGKSGGQHGDWYRRWRRAQREGPMAEQRFLAEHPHPKELAKQQQKQQEQQQPGTASSSPSTTSLAGEW